MHARQHYELVSWRRADTDLNYRRFFAINTLVAVRVEDPEWFERSHEEISRWFDEGLVDGLRIDHPDGLRDPVQYLADLEELTSGSYVLIEKILEPGEELPTSWATAGTTGYDVMAMIDRVLTDPAGEKPLSDLETRLRGAELDWHEMVHDTKRAVTDGILRSEVRRIVRDAGLAQPPRRSSLARPRRSTPLVGRACREHAGRPPFVGRACRDHPRGRGGRAAGLLPRLPLLPARGARAPRAGLRRGQAAPTRSGGRLGRAAPRARRRGRPRRRSASSRPAAWSWPRASRTARSTAARG